MSVSCVLNNIFLLHCMSLIRKLIFHRSSGSLLLFVTSIIAIFMRNSKACIFYEKIIYFPIKIFGGNVNFILLDLINEGIMTIFFLYVGLDIKSTLLQESVNKFSYLGFSIISAVGGMLFPAIFYIFFTYKYPVLQTGWAIPTTTDIVFSLSMLSTIKNKSKFDLKIFLMLLATIDDLFSILIVAIFYTKALHLTYLYASFLLILIMMTMNYFRVRYYFLYLLSGIILWILLFFSGVHATLSGAITGIMIPNYASNHNHSIIKQLLKKIDPYVKYLILPVFGFMNSGIIIKSNFYCFCLILPLSIVISLVIGKSVGITLFSYISMKLRAFSFLHNVNITDIFSISVLCGIGFTMSIFISNIAFNKIHEELIILSKIGILIGSSISAILGYILVNRTSIKN